MTVKHRKTDTSPSSTAVCLVLGLLMVPMALGDVADPHGTLDMRHDESSVWIDPSDMGMGQKVIPNPHSPRRLKMSSGFEGEDGKKLPGQEAAGGALFDGSGTAGPTNETSPCHCNCGSPEGGNRKEAVYLKRFVKVLRRTLGIDETPDRLVWSSDDFVEYSARLRLSRTDLDVLQGFHTGGARHLQDLDQVLSHFLVSVTLKAENDVLDSAGGLLPYLLRDFLPGEDALIRTAVACCVTLWIWLLFSGRYHHLLKAFFFPSVLWHWWHMYKRSLSESMATLAKDVPKECSPNSMTMSDFLKDAIFGSSDKCADYYEALNVNPLLVVSPTMAVAETISSCLLLPLEHLGKNFSKFFKALTSELSWMLTPYVLLCVSVILVLVVVMAFRYQLRLPFLLGSFGPCDRGEQHRLQLEKEQLQRTISELQGELRHSGSQAASLQLVPPERVEAIEAMEADDADRSEGQAECCDSGEIEALGRHAASRDEQKTGSLHPSNSPEAKGDHVDEGSVDAEEADRSEGQTECCDSGEIEALGCYAASRDEQKTGSSHPSNSSESKGDHVDEGSVDSEDADRSEGQTECCDSGEIEALGCHTSLRPSNSSEAKGDHVDEGLVDAEEAEEKSFEVI